MTREATRTDASGRSTAAGPANIPETKVPTTASTGPTTGGSLASARTNSTVTPSLPVRQPASEKRPAVPAVALANWRRVISDPGAPMLSVMTRFGFRKGRA